MPPIHAGILPENRRIQGLLLITVLLTLAAGPVRLGMSFQAQPAARERVRTEIPYREGTVVMLSDLQERLTKTRYRASGHVEITYQDIVLTGDEVEYDEQTQEGFAKGQGGVQLQHPDRRVL
jgi:lipopolysaccharide assembly outer membrane protein LptD (OstA)